MATLVWLLFLSLLDAEIAQRSSNVYTSFPIIMMCNLSAKDGTSSRKRLWDRIQVEAIYLVSFVYLSKHMLFYFVDKVTIYCIKVCTRESNNRSVECLLLFFLPLWKIIMKKIRSSRFRTQITFLEYYVLWWSSV